MKLQQYSFHQSVFDHYLQAEGARVHFLVLIIYVDDILATGATETIILAMKEFLDKPFTTKDFGYVKYFLGLKTARSPSSMF